MLRLEENKRYLSLDAETDGLWGNPFAIGMIVYELIGGKLVKLEETFWRLPDSVVKNEWVVSNVLPTLDFPVTHESYEEMLKNFSGKYMSEKNATMLWHMGHIVESHLFRELHKFGFIGDWDAPYVPVEVSALLAVAGEKADSVDTYAEKYGIGKPTGSTHNPLYDCEVTAKVFEHLCLNN